MSSYSNKPIICLVLNIGQKCKENVFIYAQDNPKDVIDSLCKKHGIYPGAKSRPESTGKGKTGERSVEQRTCSGRQECPLADVIVAS